VKCIPQIQHVLVDLVQRMGEMEREIAVLKRRDAGGGDGGSASKRSRS
jgi:hypothetical protein